MLEILTGHGIGYALWNFRGSFGLLDSGRKDVEYEDWHGHQLDRSANRITMGLITSALIVGTAIALTVPGGPEILGLP